MDNVWLDIMENKVRNLISAAIEAGMDGTSSYMQDLKKELEKVTNMKTNNK